MIIHHTQFLWIFQATELYAIDMEVMFITLEIFAHEKYYELGNDARVEPLQCNTEEEASRVSTLLSIIQAIC